ncbi:unnamed protein product [Orchesella dallaii]|uniref:Uncharacterized protein n=1 Tax=Orchesella dallaii TaxID=48710 RepID=A0ABP1RLU5_9HEXA
MKLATGMTASYKTTVHLNQFGVICDENCEGYWRLPFLGQNRWQRVSEKKMQFFTGYRFWAQFVPNFATRKFSNFLGLFVESGLYDWVTRRYRVLRQYRISNGLRNLQQVRISNGSLLSYLMIGKDIKRLATSQEEPTKASALKGTFLITGMVLVIDDGTVSIGCIACASPPKLQEFGRRFIASGFEVSLRKIPEQFMDSHCAVKKFWMNVHSKLDFGHKVSKQKIFALGSNCRKVKEKCELYQVFFEYMNCSNFDDCENFFVDELQLYQLPSTTVLSALKIVHYGLQKTHFTLQLLFPRVKILDGRFSPFFTPFLLVVWLGLLISLGGIAFWLILAEGLNSFHLLFWQLSILLEQDVNQLKATKIQSHVIIIGFIFSGIVFRQFYGSCLYSFMVAEPQPTDYPKNIEELLNQNKFVILTPRKLVSQLHSLVFDGLQNHNLEGPLLLEKIILGSYIMQSNREIETLKNITNQIELEVFHYSPTMKPNGFKLPSCLVDIKLTKILPDRLAVICDENCDGYWKLPFSGKTQFKISRSIYRIRIP